jgi:hypothetical protein
MRDSENRIPDGRILQEIRYRFPWNRCQCYYYRHLDGYPQTCEFCETLSVDEDVQVREISIPGAFEPIYV